MIFLGFYLGHDSNIAVSINGKIKYRKAERHYEKKHHKTNLQFVYETLKDWDITKVDYCCYTDGNRNNLGECSGLSCDGVLTNFKSFNLDHHYAHILSMWPIKNVDELDYGVIVDGRGDNNLSAMVIKSPGTNPEVTDIWTYPNLGYEFYTLGNSYGLQGLEYDIAGKLMGLQAYSEENIQTKFNLPKFTDISDKFDSLKEWHDHGFVRLKSLFQFDNHYTVGYVGGVAQNTVYNYKLKQEYPNIIIPPHCYDGGLSLGCLEFLRRKFNQEPFDKTNFPFWQDDTIPSTPSPRIIKRVAKLLSQNKIVGWMQGRGELGPRALGNRSILMSATNEQNKDILNLKVKKREPWRPYAGSILKESHGYFDMNNSPYMLYACSVLNKNIPAITHVDNTCRMQTVVSGLYADLINEYYNLTNTPVILNTSLNIGGMPIVSKESTALSIFKTTQMDAICIGDQLLEKPKFL